MDLSKGMLSEIAIGVGCRKGVGAESILSLTRQIMRDAPPFARAKIFTIFRKAEEPGLIAAASTLGLDLVLLDEAEFLARQGEFLARGATPSEKTQALTGFASVAEAAALMGGGPSARLIVSRRVAEGVTAAIAAKEDEQ
jgi:cobalamin biosynthesis protein CbiG